jgi:hypothetical protein
MILLKVKLPNLKKEFKVMKVCNRCKINKSTDDFYKNSHNGDGLKSICKQCTSKTAKLYYDNNQDKAKELSRKHYVKNKEKLSIKSKEDWKNNPERRTKSRLRPYKLTSEEFDSLLLRDDNKCSICSLSRKEHFIKYKRDLYIDHCHVSNKIRGILCHNCNLALGNFKDDKKLLNNAIIYLEKWQH